MSTFNGNVLGTSGSWLDSLRKLEKEINLICVRKGKSFLFPLSNKSGLPELKQKVKGIIDDYNCLVSIILEKQNLFDSKGNHLITPTSLSHIDHLQQRLIESPVIRLYAIWFIRASSGSQLAGVDGVCFTSLKKEKTRYITQKLKGTRYGKSSKKFSIKKDLPKVAKVEGTVLKLLKTKVDIFNRALCLRLYDRCSFTTLYKNYRSGPIKRV